MRLGVGLDPGCYWVANHQAYVYVPFGGGDRRDLVTDVAYSLEPRNQHNGFEWVVPETISVTRQKNSK